MTVDGLRHARRIIPDFQVHGMKCEAGVVMLDGWNATYEIDLIEPVGPRIGKHAPGKLKAGYEARNLAQWNRAAGQNRTQRLSLPWPGTTLEIENRTNSRRCEYEVEARIVGEPLTMTLLERTFERDCGD